LPRNHTSSAYLIKSQEFDFRETAFQRTFYAKNGNQPRFLTKTIMKIGIFVMVDSENSILSGYFEAN
jgi:hypothetical protein